MPTVCASARPSHLWLRRCGGLRPLHLRLLSNSIDEARDGHGNNINVTRCPDGSVIVEDFGRGCPVDWNKGGALQLGAVFCELYAGGKYGKASDNYEFSLGLNGLGLLRHPVLLANGVTGYLPRRHALPPGL